MRYSVQWLVVVLTIGALLLSGCKRDKPPVREALINFLVGEVTVISQKGTRSASVGDALHQGMKIETGPGASVEIFIGSTIIKILENSKVTMTQLMLGEENSEQTGLFMEEGRLYSQIVKKLSRNDSYRVETPTTVVAVRGTEFFMEEEGGKSGVYCTEGKVLVRESEEPEDKAKELNAGQEAVKEKDKPLIVKELSVENRTRVQDVKKNIKEMREDIRNRLNLNMEEDVKKLRTEGLDRVKAEKQKALDALKGDPKASEEMIDQIKSMKDKNPGETARNKAKDMMNDLKNKPENLKDSLKPPGMP